MTDPAAVVAIPPGINAGLSSAKRSTMIALLGMPRDTFDGTCRPVTNAALKRQIVLEDVGPFRVTGLKPAVDSLRAVLADVRIAHPDVHDVLETAGMLCVREIRGTGRLSNHSWGCAIDLKIRTALDGISVGGGTGGSDGRTLAGLVAIAPIFNAAGWFWGVGFSSFEDGMHFEVADETIRRWHADGILDSSRTVAEPNLSIGDVGAEVKALQRALAARGFDIIGDGHFGPITHSIVMDFQASAGLVPDGIVGPRTRAALGL